MAGGFTIFNDGLFRVGLGDANNDGRLDFDFGLRSQSYGGSPWGWGHQGAEIGLNTNRGVYFGGDYSNHNVFGSQSGQGRIFTDGGYEASNSYRDVFGNYGGQYSNTSPHHYYHANGGGNFWSGNYYNNQSGGNAWGWGQSSSAGNMWNGSQVGSWSQGDWYGHSVGGNTWIPPYGMNTWYGSGAFSAGRFLGW